MRTHTPESYTLATKKGRPPATKTAKPNYKWFQNALSDRRLSQRELARRLNMDAGGLNRRLRGKSRLQIADCGCQRNS